MARRSPTRAGILPRALRVLVAGLSLAVLTGLIGLVPAGAAEGDQILIYGPSLAFEFGTGFHNEETLAEASGATVTVWDVETWAAATAEDFAAFDAIVFGDPDCGTDPSVLDTAVATSETWAPVVTGSKIVIGTDPVFHANVGGGGEAALALT